MSIMKNALSVLICLLFVVPNSLSAATPIRIGAQAVLPDNPRSHYNRYVNWRPADGETVRLNPPRLSWPYCPDGPNTWYDALYTFTLQISSNSDCSQPLVNVTCPFNFYNTIPALQGADTWYWRVGYDVDTRKEKWSKVRSFAIADGAVAWDRSALAQPQIAKLGHPRVLFNNDNIKQIRQLAKTNASSKAALSYMCREADEIMRKPWWHSFPKTDREKEPKQEFFAIAGDLVTVCFVWRMTEDDKYAGVRERAVTWASYPPGGRASPEGRGDEYGFKWGHGGDGSEDATQGSEFLALLFDWLYHDLSEAERNIMIKSMEWRIDHIMNTFAWKVAGTNLVHHDSLSGMVSSHRYESSMDTAVCGLVLYEHSKLGRECFEVMLNYLMGITCGQGFDEAWNEGAGYGSSKCKWLMNASLYFDTTLSEANLGRNPAYGRIGEFFRRIIPVGMPHHAWGNQRDASPSNHKAHFRKLAYLTGDGRFLLNWQQYGGRQFSKWRPWLEYILPAYYQEPRPEPEKDNVGLFPVAGWGMAATAPPSLRSTYEDGVGLIFQCRTRGGFSHSFNSDASFQLHAYGQMINHGGGGAANQDAYVYHTMSHNTILVDGLGQAQPSRGQLYPTYGRIVGFERGENYVYFAGDATRCYPEKPGNFQRWGLPLDSVYKKRALGHLRRFVRHMLFLRGKYFVIFDDLETAPDQPARFTWLYHILPEQPFAFDPQKYLVQYRVGDVRTKLMHVAHRDNLQLDDRGGLEEMVNPFTGEDYRAMKKDGPTAAHNLWITNNKPASQFQFLAVVYPYKQRQAEPRLTRIDNATVRIQCGDEPPDIIHFGKTPPRETTVVVDWQAIGQNCGRRPWELLR